MQTARRGTGALVVFLMLLPAAAVSADGRGARAEVVTFGAALAPALMRVAAGASVEIADWPVAPGEREDLLVTRFDVYAPEARLWKVEGDLQTEVPRSRLAFFRGAVLGDPETRIFLGVDPDTGTFQGLALSPAGSFVLRPYPRAAQGRGHLVTVPEDSEAAEGTAAPPLSWTCGASDAEPLLADQPEEPRTRPLFEAVIGSLHTVTVAVDTDNELLLLKFSNNTTSATNYLAALFAALNVIYERDLNIRLLQGTTFLRVSTTADPYTVTGSPADMNHLNEFANYWSANYGAVTRGLAMMLSGKTATVTNSSGIARRNGLCSTTQGYSFTQVFLASFATAADDAAVVGHELGHNFGSPHTHDPNGYIPPIDTCAATLNSALFNCVTQCGAQCEVLAIDGALACNSCPAATTINGVANVRGTLMSYCHVLTGCAKSKVFHPRTVDLITGILTPKIGVCVFPAIPPPSVSGLSPNTGTTAGGTSVAINGANFQNGATVSLGGTSLAVTFNSSSRLTVTAPAHTTGPVGVVVTNPDGGNVTKANAYFYTPPPAVTDFYTLTPCRVFDTRNANGPTGGPIFAANAERNFTVIGSCGVPANAVAIMTNVTIINPTVSGYLSVDP
ncbi:MAG TPA: hypothetical protein DD490_25955, partial [Acidobacteria bacterium]|nr:hypothetical protein [Acidobacteriota bacterium]